MSVRASHLLEECKIFGDSNASFTWVRFYRLYKYCGVQLPLFVRRLAIYDYET